MVLSVMALLVLAAFLLTLASALNPPRAPLWVAVLLLVVLELLRLVPLR
jgi:hypothetical protein